MTISNPVGSSSVFSGHFVELLWATGQAILGLETWMAAHRIESVEQMKGSMSLQNCAEPKAFVRANYLKILQSYGKSGV